MLRCAARLFLTVLPAQTAANPVQPTWQRTRAIWFANGSTPSIAAEFGVAWEALAFDAAAARAWDDAKTGERVALGATVWPTFETFTDVHFGKVGVRPGPPMRAQTAPVARAGRVISR